MIKISPLLHWNLCACISRETSDGWWRFQNLSGGGSETGEFGESLSKRWIIFGKDILSFILQPFMGHLVDSFTHLPNFIPNLIWLLFNVWCLYRIGKLLVHYLDLELVSKTVAMDTDFNLPAESAFYPLVQFSLIQLTIFLLWGSLEKHSVIQRTKYIRGGMLLALIINIKILPIVLLPYLLYRNEWKSFVSCLLFLVVFLSPRSNYRLGF